MYLFPQVLVPLCAIMLLVSSMPTLSQHSPLSRRWFIPTREQADQQLIKTKRPRKDKAVYYTGTTAGAYGPQDVLPGGFSRNNDMDLIQDSFGVWTKPNNNQSPWYGIMNDKSLTDDDRKSKSQTIWEIMSESFAQATSGEVHVVLGSTIRPDSVWNRIELPILQAKPDVTIFDVGDGANLSKKNRKQIWPASRQASPAGSPRGSPSRSGKVHRRSLAQEMTLDELLL